MRHLSAIDGLRAVAVLAVVAYHAGLPVPAGYVGVDIFFVISGYLITRLLFEEIRATGRVDLFAFYARRARRILPAMAVVVAVTLALSWGLLNSLAFARTATSAAAASAFSANIYFQVRSGGYWDASASTMPLLHLWSLSVEEQFYLLWPLVLFLGRRRPVLTLACVAIVSFAIAEWLIINDPSIAFYQMPSRAWELAVGGLVALNPIRLPRGTAWIGVVATVGACFLPLEHFPGIGALPAVLGAAILIGAVQDGERLAVLESRFAVFIGLISYSLYLWHWPLLALQHAVAVGPPSLTSRLGLCLVGLVLAVLSYHFVERPFRKAVATHRRVLALGFGALAIMTCSALALGERHPKQSRFDAGAFAETDFPANRGECHESMRDQPMPFSPRCQTGSGTADVVVWGDSMGMAWEPYAYSKGHVGVNFTRDACAPFVGYVPPPGDKQARWCRQFNDLALARARSASLVVLAGLWIAYPDVAPIERTLTALRGRRVIIIGPTPILAERVPDCLRANDMGACAITRAAFERVASPTRTILKSLAQKHGAMYVEAADFFCTPTICPAQRHGIALYWDANHITSTAAREFAREH